jgi:hypothetical protein
VAVLELARERADEAGAGGHRSQHRAAARGARAGRRQGRQDGAAAGQEEGRQARARVAAGAQLGQDEARDPEIAGGEPLLDQVGGDGGHAGEPGIHGETVELFPAGGHGLGARVGEQPIEIGVGQPLQPGDGRDRQTGERAPDDPPAAEPGDGEGTGGRGHDQEPIA